jgi:HK97 family phage prohead protease
MRPTPATLAALVRSGDLDLADPYVRHLLTRAFGRVERRNARSQVSAVRLRTADDVTGRVRGIASAYGVEYAIGAGIKERIERGAFAASIAERPVVPLFGEHDWLTPIGAATVSDSPVGLAFEGDLFLDVDRARAIHRAAQAGAVTDVSVGFIPASDGVRRERHGALEVVTRAEVVEVSIVLRGANPAASLQKVS